MRVAFYKGFGIAALSDKLETKGRYPVSTVLYCALLESSEL